jgi:hypothetical protein
MPEQALGALFSDYVLDANYDEMFESTGTARPHCRALFQELRGASEAELSLRQLEADKAFLLSGFVTGTVGPISGFQIPASSSRYFWRHSDALILIKRL